MDKLADLSRQYAAHANRSGITPWDLCETLEGVMGANVLGEIIAWADDEGILRRDVRSTRSEAIDAQLARLKSDDRTESREQHPTLEFAPVAPESCALAEAEACADQVVVEALVWGADRDVDALIPKRADTLSAPPERETIPHYLPLMPKLDKIDTEMDLDEAASGAMSRARTAPKAALLPQMYHGLVDDDGVRSMWRTNSDFDEAAAEAMGPADDLPSADATLQMCGGGAVKHPRDERPASSMAAFTHALDDVTRDQAAHPPGLLTSALRTHHGGSSAAAFRDAAIKRRRLAHCFADATRYQPKDTMHGCVHAHPTSPAWAPGPSLLITLSQSNDDGNEDAGKNASVPVFTPVHPQGRCIDTGPPAGAMFPTLGYRHPAQLFSSLYMVAYPELQRVSTHSADPPALLDDHHTERVYHGTAVARDVMTGTMMSVQNRGSVGALIDRYRGGNSILHATLERLRLRAAHQSAKKRAEMDGGEQLEQMDREPIRGERIRLPRSGTLVHAWDWAPAAPHAGLDAPR